MASSFETSAESGGSPFFKVLTSESRPRNLVLNWVGASELVDSFEKESFSSGQFWSMLSAFAVLVNPSFGKREEARNMNWRPTFFMTPGLPLAIEQIHALRRNRAQAFARRRAVETQAVTFVSLDIFRVLFGGFFDFLQIGFRIKTGVRIKLESTSFPRNLGQGKSTLVLALDHLTNFISEEVAHI